MRSILSLASLGAVLCLYLYGAAADAAPLSAGAEASGRVANPLMQIDYRRCWRKHGRTHCRWYRTREYSGGSGRIERQPIYDSRQLPFGSKRWWEQIERESGDRR